MSKANRLEGKSQPNLRTSLEITFHTKLAVGMIEGTGRKNNSRDSYIVGLLGFASKAKIVYLDMRKKNPYAIHFYELAEKSLEKAIHNLAVTNKYADDIFEESEKLGIRLSISKNLSPALRTFQFMVPFCFLAATQLQQFDLCVRKLESARQVGIITRRKYDAKVELMSKPLRSLFHCLVRYKSLPVSINDIQAGTEVALQAVAQMGLLPAQIEAQKLTPA